MMLWYLCLFVCIKVETTLIQTTIMISMYAYHLGTSSRDPDSPERSCEGATVPCLGETTTKGAHFPSSNQGGWKRLQ